jgi:hypothetical protein
MLFQAKISRIPLKNLIFISATFDLYLFGTKIEIENKHKEV